MKMSAISHRPAGIIAAPFNASSSQHSRKLIQKNNCTVSSAKRLDFWGGLVSCEKSVSWVIRRRRNNQKMSINKGFNNWVRARAGDDQCVDDQAFDEQEEEASMEELRPLTFGAGGNGIEATLNNLSKSLVAAVFAMIFLLRHDGLAIWATVGGLLNNQLSVAIKRILKQSRPFSALRSDPGMPSSHSQSFFYTTLFLNLSLVEWFGVNAVTITLSGFFLIVASYFSWLRVSQQFHTVSQVIVGAALGSIIFIFWFWLWYHFVLNLFVSS